MEEHSDKGADSATELLLLTLIPGLLPDMNRDLSSTPKKPINVNPTSPR
jgi:hypothetical protein